MTTDAKRVCPYCQSSIGHTDSFVVCPKCGMPHHSDCWSENGGCTTYGCLGATASASPPVAVVPANGQQAIQQPLNVTPPGVPCADRRIGVLPWLSRLLANVGAVIGLIVGLVAGGSSGGIFGALFGAFVGCCCLGPFIGAVAPYGILLCLCMRAYLPPSEDGPFDQLLLGLVLFAVLALAGHIPVIPVRDDQSNAQANLRSRRHSS